MAVRVVIDRRRCIGAGHMHSPSRPPPFQWRQGDFVKPELRDPSTVDEDLLREVAAACPTRAIVIEEVLEPVTSSEV